MSTGSDASSPKSHDTRHAIQYPKCRNRDAGFEMRDPTETLGVWGQEMFLSRIPKLVSRITLKHIRDVGAGKQDGRSKQPPEAMEKETKIGVIRKEDHVPVAEGFFYQISAPFDLFER